MSPEHGWDRVSTSAWEKTYGDPFPSVIAYSAKTNLYTDSTRNTVNSSLSSLSQPAMFASLLKRSGDILYLGNDQKIGTVPLSLDQQLPGAPKLNLKLEYWNILPRRI